MPEHPRGPWRNVAVHPFTVTPRWARGRERERDRRNRERGNTARCQQGLAVSEARSDTHSASYKHTERLGIRRCGLQNWPCTGFAKHLRDFPASRKHSNSLERIVKPRTVSRLFSAKGSSRASVWASSLVHPSHLQPNDCIPKAKSALVNCFSIAIRKQNGLIPKQIQMTYGDWMVFILSQVNTCINATHARNDSNRLPVR